MRVRRRVLLAASVALAARRREVAARTLCHHTPEFRRKASDPFRSQLVDDMQRWTGSVLADVLLHPLVAQMIPPGGAEMVGGTVFRLKLGAAEELAGDFWLIREVCFDPEAV